MHVPQNVVKEMLINIKDPNLRAVYGGIINGTVVSQVSCTSEDIIEERELPVVDNDGKPVTYKIGSKRGQPKMELQQVVVKYGCKGRVIALIDDKGAVTETEPVADPTGNQTYCSGLEGSRQRFDGQMGFRCYCGNNSILCEEEKGVITPARPTANDLQKIANRLSKRQDNIYIPNEGKTEIDGFIITELGA